MATDSTLSQEFLAQSKVRMATAMYAIPIGLEAFSTGWRLLLAARAHTRWFTFDDYLMLFTTLVAIAECATGLAYGPPYGLGRHIEAVPEHDVQVFLKGDYIFSHLYDIAVAFAKLCVLALYHRVFAARTFRVLVVGTACFVFTHVVAMEVVLGVGCRPTQAWWDETQGKCIDKEAFAYFANVSNMMTDLWIVLMPIPAILGLRGADKERRAILSFAFGLGLATCAVSTARLPFVFGVASEDFTWDDASLGILSAWEPCGAILSVNSFQIYRHLAMAREALLTAAGSDRRGGYAGRLQHHDWARLDNGDGLSGEATGTVTEVSAQKRPIVMSVELDELKAGGIIVQRAFTQSSAHDLLATAAEGTRWKD